MNKSILYSFICLVSFFVKAQEKPNIIFILTDDQQYNTIHTLGNNKIITPNIDKLVHEGTTFINTYNMGGWTGAVCVPSRGMLVSGLSVWDTEKNNKILNTDAIAQSKTWPVLLRKAGYETYMTGKWHVKVDAKKVFDIVVNERPGMPKDAWSMKAMRPYYDKLKELDSPERNELLPIGYGRPLSADDNSWSPSDPKFGGFWEGGKHWSEVLKDDAVNFIEQAAKKDNPFFMYLAFNAPHDPRQAPQKYIDMYPLDNISIPENFLTEYPYNEDMSNGRSQRGENLAPFPRTKFAVKKHIQEYYASITHIDEQLGRILKALKTSGKAENTIIVLTSDHGLAMGQHGMFSKSTLFEHSTKVPFIIVGKNIPKNKKIETPIYLQDIVPTTLEWANTEIPNHIFFKSLNSIIKNKEQYKHYNAIYGAMKKHQRSITQNGFKLMIFTKIKKVQLFDLKNDPFEINNLADNSAYKDKTIQLFNELFQLQKEMKDELDISNILIKFQKQ